ncbi:MAG TPA: translation initiation factor IF-2, partial [Planctomycetaceae bacterium]|nr:translation initiation factor IF-2 [Planctomycetaceae bacterium]
MKVRIFALAKELGIDAKELIKHCAEAGVKVKSSSALASISQEERDIVVQHIEKVRAEAAAAEAAAPMAPVRETTRKFGKVRTIKPMTPRPRVGRVRPR